MNPTDYSSIGDAKLIIPIIINRPERKIREFAPLDYYDVVSTRSLQLVRNAINWIESNYPGYSIMFSRVHHSSALLLMGEFPQKETFGKKTIKIGFINYLGTASLKDRMTYSMALHNDSCIFNLLKKVKK